jgi:hypothetical protein
MKSAFRFTAIRRRATSFSLSANSSAATQEGEISFCAYNTGVGWRNIIEKMHMTATLSKWYEEKGRHEITAGDKSVNLTLRFRRQDGPGRGQYLPTREAAPALADNKEHTLVLKMEDVNKLRQHDLDDAGIAKTAREEKTRARDLKAKDAEMAKLYREDVLGEKPLEGFVHLGAIAPAAPKAAPKEKEVGSFGD